MNKSDSIAELAKALSAAQAQFEGIPRTKEVLVKSDKGSYKFYYAPLDKIVDYIRPILAEHGLAFSQGVCGDFLETTLMHISGEWKSDSVPIKGGGTSQAYGSELTYKRRYSLTSMLGLVTEDDDDASGNGDAEEKKEKKVYKKVATEEYNQLPVEVQVQLKKVADQITADFYTLTIAKAFTRYEKEKAYMSGEEQIGMWSLLDSKVRSALKKEGLERREKAKLTEKVAA